MLTVNPTLGLQIACATTMSTMADDSVAGRFWKESLAGILANKCNTSMMVPGAIPIGSMECFVPSLTVIDIPSDSAVRLDTLSWLTIPILAKASPRNPSV